MTITNIIPSSDQLDNTTNKRTKHPPFVLQTVVLNQANKLLKKTKKEEKEVREIKQLMKKIISQLKKIKSELKNSQNRGNAALGAINYAISEMENLIGNIDCKLLVQISDYVTDLTKRQADLANTEEGILDDDQQKINGDGATLQKTSTKYGEDQSIFENALSVVKNFLSSISSYLTNTTSDSQNITKNIQPVIDILTYLTQRLHQ